MFATVPCPICEKRSVALTRGQDVCEHCGVTKTAVSPHKGLVVRRIQVFQFALVMALVCAVLAVIGALLSTAAILIAAASVDPALASLLDVTLPSLFVGPLLALCFGYISGIILALVYNYVASRVGGIRLEVDGK